MRSGQLGKRLASVINGWIAILLLTWITFCILVSSAPARERNRDDLNLLKLGLYLSPVGFNDQDKPGGSTLVFYNVSWEPEYMITDTLEWKVVEVGLAFNAERFESAANFPTVSVLPGALGLTIGTGLTENFSLNRQFNVYMGPEIGTTLYLTKFGGVTRSAEGQYIDKLTETNFDARDPTETVVTPPFPRSGTFSELLLTTNYKNVVGFPFLNTPLDLFAVFGAQYYPLEGNFSVNAELNTGFRAWGYTFISPAAGERRMDYGGFYFRFGLGLNFDGGLFLR
jgi:hypothetical protein